MVRKITIIFSIVFFWMTGFAQQRTDSVHVAHYDINLSVLDFTNNTIDGHTDITVVSKVNNLTQLRLDLMVLTVDSVTVNQNPVTFSHVGEALFVNVPAMQSGDTALVRVYYHGSPAHDGYFGGFYFNGGYAYNVGVALSDIPHSYGRCWYPCLDEFTDKSSYSFHIRTLGNHKAICNGLLTDSLTLADNTRLWTWQLDEIIPAYLVSMAVGNYFCYADTFHGMEATIPINIYASPQVYPNIEASFAHLKNILRNYESHFGPYRWPRVGYVCVGMTGGAMEHATNIALPNAAVNGSLSYEGTIMHELFHHWFGDLITCERPEEMWINEGFADYSEALVQEWLYNTETTNAYAEHIRDEHITTLQNLAKQDGGLYALDNVPQEQTYGMHSYQKGGQVIHTLRYYMGDSLFFSGLSQLLNHFAYQNVNSEQFFTYLSQVSGMNLMNFYEDWVHQPGFLDFDVEKLQSLSCGIYLVQIRQKGYGTEHLGTQVPIDVTFVSEEMEFYTYTQQMVSGDTTELLLVVPFRPEFVILDRSEKLSDATIGVTKKVSAPGSVSFQDAYCNAQIDQLSDTSLIHVEHHYVAPTAPNPLPEGYYQFSGTHYWTVNYAGAVPQGSWKFRLVRANGQPDADLFANGYTLENLKLMYRPDCQAAWTPVAYTRTGSPYNSTITTDLLPGQYCYAMAEEDVSVNTFEGTPLKLFPNPAKDQITLCSDITKVDRAVVFDSLGNKIKSFKLHTNTHAIDLTNLSSGNYIIVLYRKGKTVARSMFVKS